MSGPFHEMSTVRRDPLPDPPRKGEGDRSHARRSLPVPAHAGKSRDPDNSGSAARGRKSPIYLGGGRGVWPKSKQSVMPSVAVVRLFSDGKPNVVSQNLTRLTWECSVFEMNPGFA